MPIKTPKSYQVDGYQETIDAVTAISKLNVPTKDVILSNFLGDENIVSTRNEARSKRQEQIHDSKTLLKLKAEKANGEMPESQLQMLAELKSKLEIGVTPKIFEGKIQDKLTRNMNEGKLNFNGTDYTFVRREGIAESFGGLKSVKECRDWTEATVYLKELFADYADQYPGLFAKTDRYNVDNSEMFPMINKWAQDNNIPYAGWQDSDGSRDGAGDRLYAWLPVRVAGRFAYVGSESDDKGAYFYCGDEDDARLSVSFTN